MTPVTMFSLSLIKQVHRSQSMVAEANQMLLCAVVGGGEGGRDGKIKSVGWTHFGFFFFWCKAPVSAAFDLHFISFPNVANSMRQRGVGEKREAASSTCRLLPYR